MLPSSVTADIPDTVWVHRSDCFDTDNVRKMGSNEIPWGFRAAAIIGDMTEQQAHPSWFACSTSHCGLGAELVANAFPVTVFPCVIWTEFVCSPCVFFFSFVHIAGILKAAMRKQNHVMRGFCRRRGADVSQHTAVLHSWTLCNSHGEAVQEWRGDGWLDWMFRSCTVAPK